MKKKPEIKPVQEIEEDFLDTASDSDTICGVLKTTIRRAYFKGGLDELLNDIQASRIITIEQVQVLKEYLESLLEEKQNVRNQLGKKFKVLNEEDIIPPSVDDLVGEINQEELEAWKVKKDREIKRIKDIISFVSTASSKRTINIEDLKDLLLEIEGFRSSVDQDRVYKDQLFRERLTAIIDDYGVSRKEAEERSKLTKEYRDYKLAVLFYENLESFIMSSKKKIGSNY